MPRTKPRIVSVGGGKGGVGKSLVAANLAVAMAHLGLRVTLVDADLGAANQHALFGLHQTGPTLQSLLDHEIESLEQAAIPTSVRGLHVVRGATATLGSANINHGQKIRLSRHIGALDAEVVVVDVGAGTSFNTLDLFDLADLKLLVVTPQLTSMQNAYGFLKGAALRTLRPFAAAEPDVQAALESVGRGETARMSDLFKRIRVAHPEVADAMRAHLRSFGARIVGNLVHRSSEVAAFSALERLIRDFLGLEAPVLGHLASHDRIHASVSDGAPFSIRGSPEDATTVIQRIAEHVVLERLDEGRTSAAIANGTEASVQAA